MIVALTPTPAIDSPGVAHLHVTADVDRLFFLTALAAAMIDTGWGLFDQRSASPYARLG